MYVSLNWLAHLVPDVFTITDLDTILTDIGLEVEANYKPDSALDNIVVGRIVKTWRLPESRLQGCLVDAGSHGEITVACGAPNLRRGMRAPLALPGAQLKDALVQKRTIANLVSAGVLCSAAELDCGDDTTGILDLGRRAPVGQLVAKLLETDDRVLDLAVTPNRGDWLSMLGVARELAAKTGIRLRRPRMTKLATHDDSHGVTIAAAVRPVCPKFTCLPVTGVNAQVPTPPLITARLRRCGVRPVSVIVDITNYVMLELGQPLHAFDRDQLTGALEIRYAQAGEQLALLDGTEAQLESHILVVADQAGPQALGGVMGGLAAGVTATTTNILLEAAHFVPAVVRGRTRELNISSEAAFRFERGVDPTMCETAITRVAKLVVQCCGGRCGQLNVTGTAPASRPPLTLPNTKVASLTGVTVPPAQAAQRLKALGFTVRRRPQALEVTTPSWRFDVERVEDLVEEIVRLGGYNTVPTTMPHLIGSFQSAPERLIDAKSARDRLSQEGFNEIITFAFVDPQWERDFQGDAVQPLALANPLSDEHSVMRTSLIGGLVDRAAYNQRRRQNSLRLFELGRCFNSVQDQPLRLAGLCWGEVTPDHWDRPDRRHDFHDVRGVVERLLPGIVLEFPTLLDRPSLHPGRAATIMLAGQPIGSIGELHPALLGPHRYDLEAPVAVFELDFAYLSSLPHRRTAQPVAKFPLVRRDLAVVVAGDVPAAALVKSTLALAIAELTDVTVFDSFTGVGVAEGKRSVGLRMTMQGTQANLVETRIHEIMESVTACLATAHGATIRT